MYILNRLNDYVIRVAQSADERSEDSCVLIFYNEIFFGRPGHGKKTLDSLWTIKTRIKNMKPAGILVIII